MPRPRASARDRRVLHLPGRPVVLGHDLQVAQDLAVLAASDPDAAEVEVGLQQGLGVLGLAERVDQVAVGAGVLLDPYVERAGHPSSPNQRCRRVDAKVRLASAPSSDGGVKAATGAGPDRKSTSTMPMVSSPISM